MVEFWFLIAILAALLLLDVAAWFGAADSREPLDSPEWERRRSWRQ